MLHHQCVWCQSLQQSSLPCSVMRSALGRASTAFLHLPTYQSQNPLPVTPSSAGVTPCPIMPSRDPLPLSAWRQGRLFTRPALTDHAASNRQHTIHTGSGTVDQRLCLHCRFMRTRWMFCYCWLMGAGLMHHKQLRCLSHELAASGAVAAS